MFRGSQSKLVLGRVTFSLVVYILCFIYSPKEEEDSSVDKNIFSLFFSHNFLHSFFLVCLEGKNKKRVISFSRREGICIKVTWCKWKCAILDPLFLLFGFYLILFGKNSENYFFYDQHGFLFASHGHCFLR